MTMISRKQARIGSASDSRELVTFHIGEQVFAVDILHVREIRGWAEPTPLPHAPAFVRGTINLRGAVLPIIDLARRLGLAATEANERKVTLVVQLGVRQMGLLVDAVSDVLTTLDDLIQPTPDVAGEQARSVIRGLLPLDGRMISLVSLGELLPSAELEAA